MSGGGYSASGQYSAPPHPQAQPPNQYYHRRPVTSDWDMQTHVHASQGAPIQQSQAHSSHAPPAYAVDGRPLYHARFGGQQGHAGDAVNGSFRGPTGGTHARPPGQQPVLGNYAHSGGSQHDNGHPPFGGAVSQPPPMHMQTADQHFEHHYVQSHGYSLHQGSRQNIHPSPPQQAHYHLPSSYAPALAPAHPRSASQMPEQHHHFQSSFDDVVDVEGAQRFRGQPQYTFHHTQRPSTAPPHAQPGQVHPQIHPADGLNDDEPVSCGVGIVFHSSGHGSLAVKRLVPGGPAARCGLIRQGDILTHIDQTNVYQQNASDINHLISGPQGSFVQLRFKRSGSSPVIAVVERVWAPSTAERSKALSNGGGPPSKISPLLWLGDSSNSRDLAWLMEHNVSCILNCAAECANHHTEKLHYLHLRLLDKPEESIRRAFEPAFSFLQKAHDAGHVAYVHCAAGRSRSATLLIAYLMKSRRMSLRDAIYVVRLARPMIKPNLGFFQQLCRFEKDLLGSKSCDITDFSDLFKS